MPSILHGRRFSDFFILPENRSAVQAVRTLTQAALDEKHSPFCPLLLHGSPGTGKTRLLTAAIKKLAGDGSSLAIRSVAATELARPDEAEGFDDPAMQECDVLIVEDVQHLPGRVAGAACDLIDYRVAHGKALVLSATVGPAGLTHLPRRLTSRLAAGLVVQLEPYGTPSRQAILEAAAQTAKVRLTPDALAWLARQSGGVRTALGWLYNLAQIKPRQAKPLDHHDVEQMLAGTGETVSTGGEALKIVKRVAAAFGVSEKELLGPSRQPNVLFPRQVAMYLTRELTTLSLPKIGAVFANRDHTTVLHACRKVEQALAGNDSLNSLMRQVRQELG